MPSKHYDGAGGSADHIKVHKALLDQGKPFVLAVFADWCGHCTRLTVAQTPNEASQWSLFLKAQDKMPVVELDHQNFSVMTNDASFKSCEFSKLLRLAVSSFPHVSVVMKDHKTNKINVHVYDGVYPMTSATLQSFVLGVSPPKPPTGGRGPPAPPAKIGGGGLRRR